MNILRRLRQRIMLTCEDVNHFLVEYLEGTLDEDMRERFEKHIARCEMCQRYLDQYQTTIGLVKESDEAPPDPPDELREKTLAFLREHADGSEAPSGGKAPSGGDDHGSS